MCVCRRVGILASSTGCLNCCSRAPSAERQGPLVMPGKLLSFGTLVFPFLFTLKAEHLKLLFMLTEKRERERSKRGLFSGNTRARFMLVLFLFLLLLHFLWPVCVCVSVNHILPPKIKFHVCVLISLIYLYWLTGQGKKKQATTTVC